jgi:hypothetical protein
MTRVAFLSPAGFSPADIYLDHYGERQPDHDMTTTTGVDETYDAQRSALEPYPFANLAKLSTNT